HYGERIELDARVRKPHNFGNPGAFDYARFLSRKEIYWTASGAAHTVHVLPGRCGSRFAKAIMDLRQAALERMERLYHGDPYQTGMMQALLIGQNFQLQRVWTEVYRSTGTFHVIVISGTHLAILAAFFLFLLRICFMPESVALAVTVAMCWVYTLVTGFQAPGVRSSAGLTLFMICGYFFRRRRALNLLAAVALGFLVLDPEQLFDASFQLTFLAVAFLGAFATPLIQATSGPFARGLHDLNDVSRDVYLAPKVAQFRIEMRLLAETLRLVARMPMRLATTAITMPARTLFFFFDISVTSAIAQFGLALPMVVYFHRVGFSGLSANALVVPLMGLALPVGFAAVVTGWAWIASLAAWLLRISQAVVAWHAAIEPNWRIPTPPVWLGVALSAATIACAITQRRWRWMAVALTATLLGLLVWHPFPPEGHPGELELTAVDVGQGDSLLVTFPDGKHMIVDAGGIPVFGRQTPSQLDTGEDVVAPYLWTRSIRQVDVIALSHAHEDHIGGMPALVDDFHPKEIWTGATPASATWQRVCEKAAKNGAKIVPLQAGRQLNFGGAQIDVLAPPADYVAADTPKNNDSLVLRIRYGKHAFLLSGDVERPIERRMLDDNELSRIDVLKVAHHGSRTSSTEPFLDAVQPQFAIISVGTDNSYGHPNRDVIDRLVEHHAAVFRTDQDGLISIRSDGKRLRLDTNRWEGSALRLMGVFR
ncbi:MAG: ComEC/Rec2 family competence protein, partial [Acidobacteriia bacterium]|nr:ComEC/Rec2 family competence protein [Terriglobia bacterium]